MNKTDVIGIKKRYEDDYEAFGYDIDDNFNLSGW